MSVEMSSEERETLAAELALGLLEDDELGSAQALYGQDSHLRTAVARWHGRFASLTDEAPYAEPSPRVWRDIERELGSPAANDNAGRLVAWKAAALSAGAVAAALAFVLVLRPADVRPPVPTTQVAVSPLVATLSTPDAALQLVATWDGASGRLFTAADDALLSDRARTRELWVIPADGTPRSLGTVQAGTAKRAIQPELVRHLVSGSTLAISIEPLGGSPTGLPTGPVIASGQMQQL